ncbi:MAG TPA: hypothetical protein VMW50_08290 [Dehalococcoidia bacterium]|nr:hypothetical protein [Dehalococcoidia bacterium]
MINEKQKPTSELYRVNWELIHTKKFALPRSHPEGCDCNHCAAENICKCAFCEVKRKKLRIKANELAGRQVYKDAGE